MIDVYIVIVYYYCFKYEQNSSIIISLEILQIKLVWIVNVYINENFFVGIHLHSVKINKQFQVLIKGINT